MLYKTNPVADSTFNILNSVPINNWNPKAELPDVQAMLISYFEIQKNAVPEYSCSSCNLKDIIKNLPAQNFLKLFL